MQMHEMGLSDVDIEVKEEIVDCVKEEHESRCNISGSSPSSENQICGVEVSQTINEIDLMKPKEENDCESLTKSIESSIDLLFTVKEECEDIEIAIAEDYPYSVESSNVKIEGCVIDVNSLDLIKNEGTIKTEQYLTNDNQLLSKCELILYCFHCNFSTRNRRVLSNHIKRIHKRRFTKGYTGTDRTKCDICNYTCRFPFELKIHYLKHEGKSIFDCYFCDYGVNKKCRIFAHIYNNHLPISVEGYFNDFKKCYGCKFETDFKLDLIHHIINKHKFSPKKLHHCQLCSYKTHCKNTLLSHVDGFHKKIRPFACHLCSYEANKSADLRIHISAKHEKITPFKCQHCNYKSGYKKHLRRHCFTQHHLKKSSGASAS